MTRDLIDWILWCISFLRCHTKPGSPEHVRVRITRHYNRGIQLMNDVTVTWNRTTTGTPTGYSVVWNLNGTNQPTIVVPVTGAGDVSGYSMDFFTSVPSVNLKSGDVVGAIVQAVDGLNMLNGPVTQSVPVSVTLPTTPVAPGAPQNVTLVLS